MDQSVGTFQDLREIYLVDERKSRLLENWKNFVIVKQSNGDKLNQIPFVNGKILRILDLFTIVQKYGGFNKVITQNKWPDVIQMMGLMEEANLDTVLRLHYETFLLQFEEWIRVHQTHLLNKKREIQNQQAAQAQQQAQQAQQGNTMNQEYGSFQGVSQPHFGYHNTSSLGEHPRMQYQPILGQIDPSIYNPEQLPQVPLSQGRASAYNYTNFMEPQDNSSLGHSGSNQAAPIYNQYTNIFGMTQQPLGSLDYSQQYSQPYSTIGPTVSASEIEEGLMSPDDAKSSKVLSVFNLFSRNFYSKDYPHSHYPHSYTTSTAKVKT